MTFSGRLRLTLILAAIFPTALITLIVLVGLSQQVKRIENVDATAACGRFKELLDNTTIRIQRDLHYVADTREFQSMEWGLENKKPIDPKYRLPLLSLDFIEYLDTGGEVLVSADRPALVGQQIGDDVPLILSERGKMLYENDLNGSHPSLALSLPTENGYIRGGIFLDGLFQNLASAVTRADIDFIDLRGDESQGMAAKPAAATGVPFRQGNRLNAVLAFDDGGQFYPLARFLPYHQTSLFSNFLTAVIVVTVISLLLVIPAGLYFSSRTKKEFENLTGGALRVASGDFSQPVEASSTGEFADLADSFNRMMRQLTDSRDRLIVSQKIAAWQTIGRKIAHEVKNPLTPISIAVDDLKHSYHENQPDFGKILNANVGAIKGEVDRLKKLIDQFSAFAKMPSPKFVQVESAAFVRDVEVLYGEEIDRGRLTIENEAGNASIQIDPDQMHQVVINLLKNSLEIGCGRCLLRLTVTDNDFIIAIEDDGPGFPEKIMHEGPTPYFSTKAHGSGLGLIISQRIVFDHDGTIRFNNKPDGGAQVLVTLPKEHALHSDN